MCETANLRVYQKSQRDCGVHPISHRIHIVYSMFLYIMLALARLRSLAALLPRLQRRIGKTYTYVDINICTYTHSISVESSGICCIYLCRRYINECEYGIDSTGLFIANDAITNLIVECVMYSYILGWNILVQTV